MVTIRTNRKKEHLSYFMPHKSKFEPLLLCIANNAEGFPELKKMRIIPDLSFVRFLTREPTAKAMKTAPYSFTT